MDDLRVARPRAGRGPDDGQQQRPGRLRDRCPLRLALPVRRLPVQEGTGRPHRLTTWCSTTSRKHSHRWPQRSKRASSRPADASTGGTPMPEKMIQERFDDLAATVGAATQQLAADRKERGEARVVDERRTKWWRRLTVVAAIGSALSILGLILVLTLFHQFQADRAQSRMTTCRQQVSRDLGSNLTLPGAV